MPIHTRVLRGRPHAGAAISASESNLLEGTSRTFAQVHLTCALSAVDDLSDLLSILRTGGPIRDISLALHVPS